jgi:hypothetical protein
VLEVTTLLISAPFECRVSDRRESHSDNNKFVQEPSNVLVLSMRCYFTRNGHTVEACNPPIAVKISLARRFSPRRK